MTTPLRSVPSLLLIALVALVVVTVLPAAGAAGTTAEPEPELGPLNPAFVKALHDPMIALGLGRLPSPVELSVSGAAEARAARASYPSAYSLVDQIPSRVTSPVKDQNPYQTCWAFANTAALESTILTQQGQATDLSEDNLSGRSGYWSSRYQRYESGGYDFMAVAYYARWAGPVTEDADRYDGQPQSGEVVKHVQGAVMIPGRGSDLDNDLIKQLVTTNGGLSVGMWMDTTGGHTDDATNAYFYPDTPEYENHGVVVVGWDDDFPAQSFGAIAQKPAGNGAFLVRNSWGDDWGSGGYFWVSYYDKGFARDLGYGTYGGCTSYSAVADVGDYSRNYGWDKLGVTDRMGYPDGSPIWAANRFTAVSIRPITAVSFYTLSSGTPYDVWAGRDFKTLTRRAKGTAALPGYATVKLATPLAVTKGKPFVVAIKLTSPDGALPLAIERRVAYGPAVFAPAGARTGQSYVGTRRWRLRDLTSLVDSANVCLKAFAR